MTNKTQKMLHVQIQASKLLSEGMSCLAVALEINKDVQTVRRWTLNPEFKKLVNEGRNSNFGDAANRLASTSFLAACTLETIMCNPETKDENRIRCAIEILNLAVKLSESLDLQHRIYLLEQASTIDVVSYE